jgi:hypothetical protein
MNTVTYFDYELKYGSNLHRVRGIADQVIPEGIHGVLNPDVFECVLKYSDFYAATLPLDILTNNPSRGYAERQLQHAAIPPAVTHTDLLIANLKHINGSIFSLPSGHLAWRLKAPFLISSLLSQGQVRPLSGTLITHKSGKSSVIVHPGKKRLSALHFLGQTTARVLVQVDKGYPHSLTDAQPIHHLSQLSDFLQSEDLYFRTCAECLQGEIFRLEVQVYEESKRRVANNLTSWEDTIDVDFALKRYGSLREGLHLYLPERHFDEIKMSVEKFFSFHDRPFSFAAESFPLRLHFHKWSEGVPLHDGIGLALNFPVTFCLSHALLLLYSPFPMLEFRAGQKELRIFMRNDHHPKDLRDMFARDFIHQVENAQPLFDSWSRSSALYATSQNETIARPV